MPLFFRSSSVAALVLSIILAGCGPQGDRSEPQSISDTDAPEKPSIERLHPHMDELIPPGTEVEIVAEGFTWSEGPVWIPDGEFLLFSDVPENRINRWSQEEGLSVWLQPSGYTGTEEHMGESGSNGLTRDAEGRLVLAQHGDRRIAILDAPLDDPTPDFITVTDRWNGMRFNSPNDLVYDSKGNLFFTDPSFGLVQHEDDPAKEIPFNGVYRLGADGALTLLDDMTARPNGVALSPDESVLYVTDTATGTIIAYNLSPSGEVSNRRIFADMTVHEGPVRADGAKVDVDGNLYATGPAGVHIYAPDGTELGLIRTIESCANLAWGDDGSTLYITADMYLMRVKTSSKGRIP